VIIYKLRNRINGKVYVGKTIQRLLDRLSVHKSHALCGRGKHPLARAIRKYGFEAYDVVALDEAERKWIAHYDCLTPKGYNCTSGGERYTTTPELIERRVAKLRGRKRPVEVKQKISVALTGRTFSSSTRERQSEAAKRRPISEQALENLKKGRGIKPSAGTKIKLSQSNPKRVLSDAQVREIRVLWDQGDWSQAKLAEQFGVGQVAISRVVRRVSYGWL
jgi:hypothetical protein